MAEAGIHIGQKEYEAKSEQIFSKKKESSGTIGERINDWLVDHSKIKLKDKVVFFRLLATMINAGVSLVKAFSILEDQNKKIPKMKKICAHMREQVEMGRRISESMRDYPEVFDESQIGMIYSGETSGKLNSVLLQIADQIESAAKLKGKIKGAMMYPMAIVFVLLCVFAAVNILVIPKLADIFEKSGAELPGTTKILIATSNFLTYKIFGIPSWIFTAIGLFIFSILFGIWKRTPDGKFIWENFVFKVPVFGNLARKVTLARFCGTISTLLKSGVAITKTLVITSEAVGNEVYKRKIRLIAEDVEQGITMEENMKGNETTWPIMLVSMIGVGEQTAQLDNVTLKLSEFYQDEVDNIVKNLSSLMEPIIILVIGGVVGFMVTAIMSPIMSMSEVVASA